MRIVRESLYNFHKTRDVKGGLNIGIKAKIKSWLDEMEVKYYTIDNDYSVDVNGSVYLNNKGLTEFPSFIKFRKVRGNFDCSENQLTTLDGVPKEVYGTFDCSQNNLISLSGSPKKVGGHFVCFVNELINLEGSPLYIGGHFSCRKNLLNSLKGSPKKIDGNFDCSRNKLSTLDGAPGEVGGWFDCSENNKKFTVSEVKSVCYIEGDIRL